MTTVMQPFQCDLQPEIPKHTMTTHTQAHPKQLQATVTLRQKKNDQPTPAAPVAHTRYLSSSPAATLHGKTHGFVLRLPPQHIADATSCSHSNAICNHRFQNTLKLRTHKHTQSSFKPPLHCGKKNDKPTAAATVAHTRYLSSSPAATSHGKTQGFVLRLPPQNITHATSCSHSNGLPMGSATGDSKTPCGKKKR